MYKKYLLIGGAGFIGSNCLKRLMACESNQVTIFDNFSTGRQWHVDEYKENPMVEIIQGDIKDIKYLKKVMEGKDTIYHFAANADIAKAVTEPSIDYWNGTHLTNNVLEAMRMAGVSRIIYTSGSGIYGDTGNDMVIENNITQLPISPYGASKLASEALISAYSHMFDMEAIIFRFANVIGPNQTHGVGYDFVRRLLKDNTKLEIMGDGIQTKSYLYIDDVIDAITQFNDGKHDGKRFNVFNVATEDTITVTEIANIIIDFMKLKNVKITYTGGNRGWKGDVPVVRIDSSRLRKAGWRSKYSSKLAMQKSIESLLKYAKVGKFDLDA